MLKCNVCAIHKDFQLSANYEILSTSLWVLRHHPFPSPLLGWILLDSKRHLSGPVDFSVQEAKSWGTVVKYSSQLLKDVTGCNRVYMIAFGEGAPHFHMHLIPRFINNPLTKSWNVSDYYRMVESEPTRSPDKTKIFEIVQTLRLKSSTYDFDL